jgi:hypothetical protein
MVLTNQLNKLCIPEEKRIPSGFSKGKFLKGLFNELGTAVQIDHQHFFGGRRAVLILAGLLICRGVL